MSKINIRHKEDCCGCSACAERCPKQCISMNEDEEGFLYPVVDASLCINCGLCEKVCPVINQDAPRAPIKVYAAKHPDYEVRLKSSSGGIFSLIAEKILDEGGVVFGARFNQKWEVEHDYITTKDGLSCFMGSKYVQSRMNDNFRKVEQFLKEGRKVLFTGTACQIAGLRKFLRKDYDNLLLVDVVCHGVPSPKVWRDYIKEYLIRPTAEQWRSGQLSIEDINSISFRDKSTGWLKYSFVATAKSHQEGKGEADPSPDIDESKLLYEQHGDNLFMRGFLSNIYLRPSCFQCPAKAGKSGSDITLGDFWGVSETIPHMDDDKGTSAVLINSWKGENFYESLAAVNVESEYQEILNHNPAISTSSKKSEFSEQFWNIYGSSGLTAAFDFMQKKLKKGFLSRVLHKSRHYLSQIIHSSNKGY
jgi:NAD-dependent dihydropyrimidine dehydrogenase PreA subunit